MPGTRSGPSGKSLLGQLERPPFYRPRAAAVKPGGRVTFVTTRRAPVHGWLEPSLACAFLVEPGEDARPHVAALLKTLDSPDASARRGALRALAHGGAKAEAALPRLRRIVRDAKAPPSDYRRAFTVRQEVPEHVLAHWALTRIEYLLREKR